ncbi:hypothetical protein [Streptomyces fungicidicus]
MDIAAAPYPVKYAFHDAVSVPTMPLIPMIVVQYDWNGRPRTLVFEPTVPDGSAEAPFYRNLRRLVDKVPGGRLAERVVLRYYNEPADVLALLGLSPESDRRVVTHPPYPGRPRSHPVRGFDSYAGSVTDHVGGIVVIPDADAPTTASPARAGDGGAGLLPRISPRRLRRHMTTVLGKPREFDANRPALTDRPEPADRPSPAVRGQACGRLCHSRYWQSLSAALRSC